MSQRSWEARPGDRKALKDVTYGRGRGVRGADDGDAQGGVDGVGEAQAGSDGRAVFESA